MCSAITLGLDSGAASESRRLRHPSSFGILAGWFFLSRSWGPLLLGFEEGRTAFRRSTCEPIIGTDSEPLDDGVGLTPNGADALPSFGIPNERRSSGPAPDGGPRTAIRVQRLVETWAEIHREELQRDWDLLQSGQPPFKIEPLR